MEWYNSELRWGIWIQNGMNIQFLILEVPDPDPKRSCIFPPGSEKFRYSSRTKTKMKTSFLHYYNLQILMLHAVTVNDILPVATKMTANNSIYWLLALALTKIRWWEFSPPFFPDSATFFVCVCWKTCLKTQFLNVIDSAPLLALAKIGWWEFFHNFSQM